MVRKQVFSILLLLLFSLSLCSSVFGMTEENRKEFMKMSQGEREYLLMYFDEDELFVVSTTRSLKSISRIAENVEVVTKEQIELMNAHTLADVLNTVNGVVVFFSGASPGSIAAPSIQGSQPEQVIVFVDGVVVNWITSDQAGLDSVPAGIIERVEVIKGPASSAWGSSLGGVINVITKDPSGKGPGGMLSASYGEQNTGDFRAELTGNAGLLGYYLYAGRLQTNGLRPFEEISKNDLYLKLNYQATFRTSLGLTFSYGKGDRQQGDLSDFGFRTEDRTERLFGTLSLHSSLDDNLSVDVSLRAHKKTWDYDLILIDPPDTSTTRYGDEGLGASAKLTWKSGMHAVTAGADYDHKKDTSEIYSGSQPELNVYAIYVNDTISFGKLTLTPGLRYDYTDRDVDFLSPSLGMTYELFDKTLARVNIARGFRLPNLGALAGDNVTGFMHNPDLDAERVWSYQAGLETSALEFLWLKVSAFRHDISDAIVIKDIDLDAGTYTEVNADKVKRQGFELAAKTKKFYNLVLSAAAAWQWTENRTTGEDMHDFPDYTYDIGLTYDDGKSFAALLHGRYVGFHEGPDTTEKAGILFDLNLRKTLPVGKAASAEVFLTGHNIFNSSQYADALFRNARRWVEAGLRFRF